VGQTLTISTSALIASSLCGAVHGAGVPFSTPPGTGLCYSAKAKAVQKAAGAIALKRYRRLFFERQIALK
jgi:hypothetical protein